MWLVIALLLLIARPLAAQPADCAPAPPTGPTVPLGIDIAGRPGVPQGASGKAYVNVPIGAPAGNACADDKPAPRDVLHGEPGDVLGGHRRPICCAGPAIRMSRSRFADPPPPRPCPTRPGQATPHRQRRQPAPLRASAALGNAQ